MTDRALDDIAMRATRRLQSITDASDAADAVGRVAIASDFAVEVLVRQPQLLSAWQRDSSVATPLPVLAADNRDAWQALLRRYRLAESARMVWRDVMGLDDVADTLAASTRLAEQCLQLGLDALETEFAQRYGQVRADDGSVQRLGVFGLGKLGGGELNFSSDVDLVYAYEHDGVSDGSRSLAAEDYFARLGQQLAKLLDEVTAEGFSHRVDLRLRPFGNSGRIALSFAAMEQYFQREGRDWERYAWQKARPVAGDLAAGTRFLESLLFNRYVGKLRFELGFWSRFHEDGGTPAGYEEFLTESTGIRYRSDGYLSDMDAGFYSADYLRAWIRSAQLRRHLIDRFGEEWWRDPQTGELLADLFRQGTKLSSEEVAARLGYDPLDTAPLLAEIAV